MEGVYKHRFQNGLVEDGGAKPDRQIMSEDVVEIVRYDASSIYVRARLNFYNGHICGISGIARYDPAKGAFVYRTREASLPEEPPCELAVSLTGRQLVLSDRPQPEAAATCRAYCGVRGSLSNYGIERSSKRKIRYLERLKASRKYRDAVAEAER